MIGLEWYTAISRNRYFLNYEDTLVVRFMSRTYEMDKCELFSLYGLLQVTKRTVYRSNTNYTVVICAQYCSHYVSNIFMLSFLLYLNVSVTPEYVLAWTAGSKEL